MYYLPQQTILNNVQHYIADTDDQDSYTARAGSNTEAKIFDEDLRKGAELESMILYLHWVQFGNH